VSIAADDWATGVTNASVNHVTETIERMPAKRFTVSPLVCGEW
jgi:hypothetical protein